MGKKGGGWFSSVKKVFKSSSANSKDLPLEKKKENKAEKWQIDVPEVVSFEHFSALSSPDVTNEESCASTPDDEEDRNYNASVVAEATAAAADAAVAAAQAAAKVVRLAGYGRRYYSREDRAATIIQSYYRGYLSRRALRALRGLVRLQALVRGHNVRKQAQMTMRCMQALVRVQARVRARRIQLTHEKLQEVDEEESRVLTKEYHCKLRSPVKRQEIEGWDSRHHTSEKIGESVSKRHDALMKRERALAYAYNYQQQLQLQQQQQQQQQQQRHIMQMGLNGKDIEPYLDEREKTQWGWNWLEHWMSSQPYHAHHLCPPEGPYTAHTAAASDNTSEKTVEMDIRMPQSFENANTGLRHIDSIDSNPDPNPNPARHQRQIVGPNNVPSYMAQTQSARAKVRTETTVKQRGSYAPHWNSSTRRASVVGSGCDSSSSGGGVTLAYQAQKSPSPNNNGPRLHARRPMGFSPDSSYGDDWALNPGAHGWRHDFG